jgi:hypothetical protein
MKSVLTPESKQKFGQENEKQSNSGILKEASLPIYDKKYEDDLFSLISHSSQPVIPPEMNHDINPLLQCWINSSFGFSDLINELYEDFISGINMYKRECIRAGKHDELCIPVLLGLLHRFTYEQNKFSQTDIISHFKLYTESIVQHDLTFGNDILSAEYCQKANNYNYEACLNQTACINRGIEDIISIINAPNATPQDLQKVDEAKCENADSKHLDTNGTGSIAQPDFIKNPDYKFTVIKNEAFDIDVMLKSLYQELNKKYISCSCNQFCNVFKSSNPRPVVWLKSYSSLSYMILLMKDKFIKTPGNISIYKVASKYFHKKEIDRYFDPHRFKCEVKDLSKCDKINLDRIFKYLRIKGNRYNAHSNDLMTNLSAIGAKDCKKNLNKLKEYQPISPANSTRQAYPPAF